MLKAFLDFMKIGYDDPCLNEKDKKLIELKYFKEMKGEELSRKLEMTENGIYKAQKRIISYMEKIYKKWTSI